MVKKASGINFEVLPITNRRLEQLLHDLRSEVTLMRESAKISASCARDAQWADDDSKAQHLPVAEELRQAKLWIEERKDNGNGMCVMHKVPSCSCVKGRGKRGNK